MPRFDKRSLPQTLLDFLGQPNSVCFAGAGVGVRAGLPDWTGYMEHLVTTAEKHEPETAAVMRARIAAGRFSEAAHYFKKCNMPLGVMYQELASPFGRDKYDPRALRPLASLPFTAFVTTNYDTSLHDAWAAVHSRVPSTAELGDATMKSAIHAREPYIARIHGRAEEPQSMVVDSDDYLRIENDPYYSDFLFHILSTQRCLFVGFSFVDPSIERVLLFLEQRVGPTYPTEHLAILRQGANELADRLRRFNIDCIHYDTHSDLWDAVSQAAKEASDSGLETNYSTFPAALEDARRLLVSAYVSSRMRSDIGPLRDHIIQGLIMAIVNDAGPWGLTKDELVMGLKPFLPITLTEAEQIVGDHLPSLLKSDFCSETSGRFTCTVDERTLNDDLEILVQGVIDRLNVREGATLD